MDEAVYLSERTKIEPLCSRWYAWSHLLAPLSLALNLTYRQLPLLRSFVANPGVHEASSRDPKFLGAPVVHLKKSDVPTVRALIASTTAQCAPLITFAEQLLQLDRQMQASAQGANIDHMYGTLPGALAGVTELTYDLNSHPSIRIYEEFLYGSELMPAGMQELFFFQGADEERPFFLNTPRLDGEGTFTLPVSFSDAALDTLALARIQPVPYHQLADTLSVEPADRPRFKTFFSAQPARRNLPPRPDGIRVRYFGHACVLIQTPTVSILLDPLFAWEPDGSSEKFTFHDLPDHIDYVFLTHNHHDHFSPETFLQLRGRIGTIIVPRNNQNSIADPSMKLALQSLGFFNVISADPLDRIDIAEGFILTMPFYGEHATLNIASKQAMYLRLKDQTLVFLADSNCLDRIVYRRIVQKYGPVDVLFIGMECAGAPLSWIYGPYLSAPLSRRDDESRRTDGSDSERAWALVEELKCTRSFVYAMGQEPWFRYHLDLIYTDDSKQVVEANKFVKRCNAANIPSRRLNGCCDISL